MSKSNEIDAKEKGATKYPIAEPHDLPPRSKWLRDYYFKGLEREWNNQIVSFTTGTDWDIVFHEGDYYINPEIRYELGDGVWIAAGGIILGGKKNYTFLGQFENNDNLYMVLRYEF